MFFSKLRVLPEKVALFSGVLVFSLATPGGFVKRSVAQVIPDSTLGSESSQVTPNNRIEGGAARGTNLFHSFSEFSIGDGQRFIFSPDSSIDNIFTRVTGNTSSQIFGTLGVNGDINFFLTNPNGVFFGPNAQLDVDGSFLASTADSIQFGDEFIFSATAPNTPPDSILTINPSALIFNRAIPGAITSQARLEVNPGESIQLAGGSIRIEDQENAIVAREGLVELAGISAPGTLGLSATDGTFQLPSDLARADINLSQVSINVAGSDQGSINLYGHDILSEDAGIIGGYREQPKAESSRAGDVTLDATGDINIISGNITNNVPRNIQGISGNIFLGAVGGIVLENSRVASETRGIGENGNIIIRSGEEVFINGGSVLNQVIKDGRGNAGDIYIEADSLRMETPDNNPINQSALISSGIRNAIGSAGDVYITLENGLTIIGRAESPTFRDYSGIIANTRDSTGDAGDIFITTNGPIHMHQRVRISATVQDEATGNGGNIRIDAQSLSLDTRGFIKAQSENFSFGYPGNIFIDLEEDLSLSNNSSVNTAIIDNADVPDNEVEGSGNITINARAIRLQNLGFIETKTEGTGNAGQINLTADSIVIEDNFNPGDTEIRSSGFLSVARPTAAGRSGDITLQTRLLRLSGNSVINASTESEFVSGDSDTTFSGGDINIAAERIELINGGQVVSSTFGNGQGEGGRINVAAAEQILISGDDPNFALQVQEAIRKRGPDDLRRVIQRDGRNGLRPDSIAPSGFFTVTESDGESGQINLQESSGNNLDVVLREGGTLSARARGQGNAGDINVNISGEFQLINGEIRTDAENSAGGRIIINAGSVLLQEDSDIRTNVAVGEDNGGNILARADSFVALDDSDILAFARDGAGGNITLPIFFGQNLESALPNVDPTTLDGNGNVDVNASGQLASGTITFPDVSFIENSLSDLPDAPIDTDSLVASSCITPVAQDISRLVLIGADSIPQQPDSAGMTEVSTVTVSSILPSDIATIFPSEAEKEQQSRGAIVESQALYQVDQEHQISAQGCP